MAATDFLLKLDKIQGETKDETYPRSIRVKTWSVGGSAPVEANTARRAGRVQMTDLVVVKEIDVASPLLMQAMANNERIAEAKLICRKAGGSQKGFFTITLTNGRVRAVSQKASQENGTGLTPEETVAFSFARIEWAYAEQESRGMLGGNTSYAWDNRTGDGD